MLFPFGDVVPKRVLIWLGIGTILTSVIPSYIAKPIIPDEAAPNPPVTSPPNASAETVTMVAIHGLVSTLYHNFLKNLPIDILVSLFLSNIEELYLSMLLFNFCNSIFCCTVCIILSFTSVPLPFDNSAKFSSLLQDVNAIIESVNIINNPLAELNWNDKHK